MIIIKLDDNVLSFYVEQFGHAGKAIYYITYSGTVKYIDITGFEQIGEINNDKKELEYKNIVSIIPGRFGDGYTDVAEPIFIDISGNLHATNLK